MNTVADMVNHLESSVIKSKSKDLVQNQKLNYIQSDAAVKVQYLVFNNLNSNPKHLEGHLNHDHDNTIKNLKNSTKNNYFQSRNNNLKYSYTENRINEMMKSKGYQASVSLNKVDMGNRVDSYETNAKHYEGDLGSTKGNLIRFQQVTSSTLNKLKGVNEKGFQTEHQHQYKQSMDNIPPPLITDMPSNHVKNHESSRNPDYDKQTSYDILNKYNSSKYTLQKSILSTNFKENNLISLGKNNLRFINKNNVPLKDSKHFKFTSGEGGSFFKNLFKK